MNEGNVMTGLEALRDALRDMQAAVPRWDLDLYDDWYEFFFGVAYTCRIGLEDNLTPDDYPMIRIVPVRSGYGPTLSQRKTEALIYFGLPIQPFDDVPDSAGRTRLEKLYAALLTMERAIISEIAFVCGNYLETIHDEDRMDTYKLMAVRCEVMG